MLFIDGSSEENADYMVAFFDTSELTEFYNLTWPSSIRYFGLMVRAGMTVAGDHVYVGSNHELEQHFYASKSRGKIKPPLGVFDTACLCLKVYI